MRPWRVQRPSNHSRDHSGRAKEVLSHVRQVAGRDDGPVFARIRPEHRKVAMERSSPRGRPGNANALYGLLRPEYLTITPAATDLSARGMATTRSLTTYHRRSFQAGCGA